MTLQTVLCGLPLVLSTSCATIAAPTEQLIASEAAIHTANEMGAPQIPSAALHLQLAREQADEARRLIDRHQTKRAISLLERARADAELSLALAQEAPLREAALVATDALQTMRKQIEP